MLARTYSSRDEALEQAGLSEQDAPSQFLSLRDTAGDVAGELGAGAVDPCGLG